VRLTRVTRTSVRATVRLTCGTAKLRRLKVRVYAHRRGHKRSRRQRTVTVPYGKSTGFTVRRRLRPGDRLELVAGPDKARGIPTLKATAQATRRLGAT
jgi:hypothetical protein